MITIELARRLGEGGVLWQPQAGDRFTIDEHDLAGDLFWISDLTSEAAPLPGPVGAGLQRHDRVGAGRGPPRHRALAPT